MSFDYNLGKGAGYYKALGQAMVGGMRRRFKPVARPSRRNYAVAARATIRTQRATRYLATRGGATYARRMTSMEKKNLDSSLNFPAFATLTGSLTLLNASVAGGLPTNRVGRRINLASVLIRGAVQLAPTSTGSSPVRIIIFFDKQTNKAAPAATDLLDVDTISGKQLLANSHRFRVLRDIIVPCVGTAGPQSFYINEYIKFTKQTEYIDGAGAGTVADITTGGLFALVYTSGGIGVAALQSGLNARVRFTDA